MAGELVQEYLKRTPSVAVQRTLEELFGEYKKKAGMGAAMHENSMRFLMAFTGYKPKSGESL